MLLHSQGDWNSWGGFHSYGGKMPIVATTLERLREHGPAGPAFRRFGREDRQNLWDAIGNARRDGALARRAEDAQEAAEREAWFRHGPTGMPEHKSPFGQLAAEVVRCLLHGPPALP
ncbi:hypothetical protein [Streptomyces graminofaciens]|uniref:hypothetical protein n=1 Tax=Streptomyces graminofaciens TaxID=68212 RepID=UPI0025737856|nr:hypothetical protein [Streptomyces graminofaciens]